MIANVVAFVFLASVYFREWPYISTELLTRIESQGHTYELVYHKRKHYRLITRDGEVIFDSPKDGEVQCIALRAGVAHRCHYDPALKDTAWLPLP